MANFKRRTKRFVRRAAPIAALAIGEGALIASGQIGPALIVAGYLATATVFLPGKWKF